MSIEVKVVSLAETFYERIGVDFAHGHPDQRRAGRRPGRPGTTITGISNRNFSGNVVGLQTPGHRRRRTWTSRSGPTSFGRAVPPFGGFTNSFAGRRHRARAGVPERHPGVHVHGGRPGRPRTNVMQAPKLTALNGTAASMTVGDLQFFVTGITPVVVNGQLVFVPQNVPFLVGITQPIPPNASIQNGLLNFTPTAPQTPGLGPVHPAGGVGRPAVRPAEHSAVVHEPDQRDAAVPVTTFITPVFEGGTRASRSRSRSSCSSRGSPPWRPRPWSWCRTAARW